MNEIAHYLPGILAAYAILLVGSLSPGPAVAMLVGVGTNQGRSSALMATLGIASGSATLNILTLSGVGLLLSQAAWAMQVIRLLGAIYLAYLAYGAFTRAWNPPGIKPLLTGQKSQFQHFLSGYALQVTNPKAISFWLAIASVNAVSG
ncbi:MAG: LysE family translocator, partial [Granulosicoccus sp.]|nr:LysE family translocator [Granulosicoccus sp.]